MNYCKPYFTNKGICNDEPIILERDDKILRKNIGTWKKLNDYFDKITDDWDIYPWGENVSYY